MTLPDNLFLRFENNRALLERGELPPPRDEGGGLTLLSAVALASLGIVGVWGGMQHLGAGAALLFDGQHISASINSGGPSSQDQDQELGGRSYDVSYTYTAPDGQRHQREASVSDEEFGRLCLGCLVPARYVRSAPQISRLNTEWPLIYGGAVTGVTGLVAGAGLLLGVGWWRDGRRQALRLRRAKLRFGTLVEAPEGERREGQLTLHYKLDGSDTTHSFEWLGDTLDGAPRPGARLAFAYEADDNLELL